MVKGRAANGSGSIYKTDKGWRGSILLNDRRRYVSGSSKTAVSEKLRALKRQADEGFVQTSRSPKLLVWIIQWLDATAPLQDLEQSVKAKRHSLKTDHTYRSVLDLYLPTWLGAITLIKLTPDHLEEAYAELSGRGLSQGTVYKLHTIIRASLNFAVKRGHVPKNAATFVISPPQPTTTKKLSAFSRADQQAIREVLKGTRSQARWEIALALGLRPGEVLALEWKHIDFDDRSIRIEQQLQSIGSDLKLVPYTKTSSSSRRVPMPEYIAGILTNHYEEQLFERGAAGGKWVSWEPDGHAHAFVFTSKVRPGRPITPSGDTTQWRRILAKAGLPKSPPYRARHTAASEMIAAGIELTVVAEILGHSNTMILQQVYAHAIEERKRTAAAVLDLMYGPVTVPASGDIEG